MKNKQLAVAAVSLLFLALLAGCSTGSVSTGTPGDGKVAIKVVFANASSVSSSGTMQGYGIAKLSLEVIPANATSYAPAEIDLTKVTSGSYTVNNLTDNETYLFRIKAYDTSGLLIWGGETPTVVLPAGTTVTVNSLKASAPSSALLSGAKTLLAAKDMTNSKDSLMLASLSDHQNNEAKLFYALSRIAALDAAAGSTNSTQMDSIKKILNASGITYIGLNTLSSVNHPKVGLPKQLPSTTPTTGQVRDYVRYYLLPEIDAALITLTGFPSTFSTIFSPAAYKLKGNDITIDYADVKTIITLLNSAKSAVALACAYNFDVNIVNHINKNITDLSSYDSAKQGNLFDLTKVLQSNTNIGAIQEVGMMTAAKTAYNAFVVNYESALNLMKARKVTSQHLFVLDNPAINNSSGLSTLHLNVGLSDIKQIQKTLNGQTTLTPNIVPWPGSKVYNLYGGAAPFQMYSAVWPSKNNTVNFSQFFNASQPVNLRTAFVDCQAKAAFNDATIAGIYPLGYVTSPIYGVSGGGKLWSSNQHYGAWAIDPIIRDSSATMQAVFNGLCGTNGMTYTSSFSGGATPALPAGNVTASW